MNNVKHFLPRHCLIHIYNSLILSHLNYCILVWGHKNKRLFKLQKKAVRIINCAKYISHTDKLFKSCNLLKLDDIFKVQLMKFLHNFYNNNLPFYFMSFKIECSSNVHQYNIRNKDRLRNYKVNNEFAKKCIRYIIANFLNSLSPIVKNRFLTHSLHSVASHYKNECISVYQTICSKPNCYVCHC